MYVVGVLLMLITSVEGYKCGQCICQDWSQTMACLGVDVSVLPQPIPWISHIDLINTSVSSLPGKDWVSLFTIDIRNNSRLLCPDVLKWKESRPDLIVLSGCYSASTFEQSKGQIWLSVLITLPIAFSSVVAYYIRRKKYLAIKNRSLTV